MIGYPYGQIRDIHPMYGLQEFCRYGVFELLPIV